MGYEIIWRVLPSLKYFHLLKGFGLANIGKHNGWELGEIGCDVWADGIKKGLGAFSFGWRIELVSRHLLLGKMCIAEMGAVIRASLRWILVLMEVLESFLLNLMVQEFRLLGEIPHDFCHFFMSDLIFAFRINCSVSVTFSELWLFIPGTVDNSGFP